jgi:glucose/arabinose dehydrogenase
MRNTGSVPSINWLLNVTLARICWGVAMSLRCLAIFGVLGCSGGHAGHDAPTDNTGTFDHPFDDADPACATPGVLPPLREQLVNGSLSKPVFVAQPPGSTDLYVVDKDGRIIINRGAALATPFLDISGEVNIPDPNAEGGLLGLAFAPDYVTSGRFFIYATLKASAGKPNRVAVREYHRSTNPDVADPTPVADLIDAPQDGYNSMGGTIAFGPDGYLWLAMGDAAGMPSDAPTLTSRRGKVLRVDIDAPATPPPGGLGGGADPYVWDYGLRNPYRFSFDRKTHDLYIADAADTQFEEVDIEPPATGHRDYGWDRMEGMHCKDGSTSCGAPGTLPVYERPHETGFSVIIGGAVYRGDAMPCLRGHYIFGMFGTGRILSWAWDGTAVTSEVELTNMFNANLTNIVAFGEDQAGELYMVLLDGRIYEIVPA